MTNATGAATMTEETKYNGWTNYETWAVKLWLDNEEPSYRYWQERAAYWADEAPNTSTVWTSAEAARYGLADELKDWHEEQRPPAVSGTVYADLLGAALSEVNWSEIASSLLEDMP